MLELEKALSEEFTHCTQVSVSLKRLRTFLKNDELDPNAVTWREELAVGEWVG